MRKAEWFAHVPSLTIGADSTGAVSRSTGHAEVREPPRCGAKTSVQRVIDTRSRSIAQCARKKSEHFIVFT